MVFQIKRGERLLVLETLQAEKLLFGPSPLICVKTHLTSINLLFFFFATNEETPLHTFTFN